MGRIDGLTIGDNPERETWLLGGDGNGLRKLSDGGTPRWSPDGKRLLICRDVVGNFSQQHQMYEFEIATGKEKLIREGRFADWSPDGKRIVFAAEGSRTENTGVHPGSQIWTADADGSGAAKLCDGNWPSWSPDGKTIAYCVQEQGKPGEIWILRSRHEAAKEDWPGPLSGAMGRRQQEFRLQRLVSDPRRNDLLPSPARFRLDKPLRPTYFSTELDNPWSPCVSRDDRITVLIVDSQNAPWR